MRRNYPRRQDPAERAVAFFAWLTAGFWGVVVFGVAVASCEFANGSEIASATVPAAAAEMQAGARYD